MKSRREKEEKTKKKEGKKKKRTKKKTKIYQRFKAVVSYKNTTITFSNMIHTHDNF